MRDVMLVCRGGHKINDRMTSEQERNRAFCVDCGAETIFCCDACQWKIPGRALGSGIEASLFPKAPEFCGKCGTAFPWAGIAVQRLAEASKLEPLAALENMLKRVHLVVRQLSRRQRERPPLSVSDEYDIQDLLHALLRLHFDDVRSEEWSPSYAGGASRMDFLLKGEQIVIEAKHTRETLRDNDLGKELLIDIARYAEHPDCKTLVCFIFDPRHHIGNAGGLVRDLERQGSERLKVQVIISPPQ
jgi:hypothetical protein